MHGERKWGRNGNTPIIRPERGRTAAIRVRKNYRLFDFRAATGHAPHREESARYARIVSALRPGESLCRQGCGERVYRDPQ
jgi:hypothetical protein